MIDLAVNSQVGGSDIVTASTYNSYLPSDLADGDDDTLAGVNCSAGELISWDGSGWVCVSDVSLTLQDITTMLTDNQMDLNANTTIGGVTIVTTSTDSDVLLALGCSDEEIAKYNTSAGNWECAEDIDTVLDETTVETYITNGSLDLTLGSNTTVGGDTIITTATTLIPAWNDITSRPSGLDDGDDDVLGGLACSIGEIAGWDGSSWGCISDATLSLSDITTMLLNNAVNLNANTTIGGVTIVTTSTDSDVLSALGCSDEEIAKYNTSAGNWECSEDIDTVLDETTVETYITNGNLDLSISTTIGGLDLVTTLDDSDTLADLSCANDGEIARYDLVLEEWYCDADIDTVLDEGTVEGYITNGSLDLNANTTIGGVAIVTSGTDSDTLSGLSCSDGEVAKYDTSNSLWVCGTDTDTQLSQSGVVNYIEGQQVNLGSGSQVNSANIVTQPTGCTNGQMIVYDLANGVWVCGTDSDTILNSSEVQAMIETVSGLALQAGTTVDGSPILTEASSISVGQLDGSAGTVGQVPITDGSTVSWSDVSSGGLTSPATLGESNGGDSYNSFDTPMTVPDNNSVGHLLDMFQML